MNPKVFLTGILALAISLVANAQSNFDPNNYYRFLRENENLSASDLLARYTLSNPYYTDIKSGPAFSEIAYLDSIILKYELTEDEQGLLRNNHFVVSERLSTYSFGRAFHDVYSHDLPVFLSTDAVLHALHASYDKILQDIEVDIIFAKLQSILERLNATYPELLNKYASNPALQNALQDIDLYITIAMSLLNDQRMAPHYTGQEKIDEIWNAIQSESLVQLPLFSERLRMIDFSQFTVRGHYTDLVYRNGRPILGPYFKTMMWLGRIDFLLTPPPENPPWQREEIRRMNLAALLLDELMNMADAKSSLKEIDDIIVFMVGKSDNLTPLELSDLLAVEGIVGAEALLDEATYDAYQEALTASTDAGQRILSNIMMLDPFNPEPVELPVSYRLMGQRFIIDSYVLSNVVYDRIIFHGQKIWRPMPDPLDVMFVLGNDDAAHLLKAELDQYKYASQLAALRYLVDEFDAGFWQQSLYNLWLQAIRLLNPTSKQAIVPLFMRTAAWHQEKLNSQLAAWTQLRHDNLLYAKQSYTGGSSCSFPHTYIEPNPDFYAQIGAFAASAQTYFAQLETGRYFAAFFLRLRKLMSRLELLARKELRGEPFKTDEIDWLRKMLFRDGGSGEPPFSGWYTDLYYNIWDPALPDYLVADVHTQPTDQDGNIVGRVLHLGVGQVNLGVFVVRSPSSDFEFMAYVGPVMSFYEKTTSNFDRLTDERWADLVNLGDLPERPDWVNIFLADTDGSVRPGGRVLPTDLYTGLSDQSGNLPKGFSLAQNYPNPFNPTTTIRFELPRTSFVELRIYNILGEEVATLLREARPAGEHQVIWHTRSLPSGLYFYRLQARDPAGSSSEYTQTRKLLLQK